jgi:hypothetical protein
LVGWLVGWWNVGIATRAGTFMKMVPQPPCAGIRQDNTVLGFITVYQVLCRVQVCPGMLSSQNERGDVQVVWQTMQPTAAPVLRGRGPALAEPLAPRRESEKAAAPHFCTVGDCPQQGKGRIKRSRHPRTISIRTNTKHQTPNTSRHRERSNGTQNSPGSQPRAGRLAQ